MHYKTKSLLTVIVLVVFMVATGILIKNVDTNITGAAVKCTCTADAECNDNSACTEDKCIYPESCAASRCINTEIPACVTNN